MIKTTNIILKHIVKTFSLPGGKGVVKAVNDMCLDVNKGELVTLLGPSGSGKTTALRMIAGFEKPDSGEIYIGDKLMNDVLPNKRGIGMVFQDYALFPHMSVFDNVAYGLKIRKTAISEIREKVKEVLNLIGLEGFENRSPTQLSGGQQQRVALARSIIIEPKVLLFDEPLSNLDAKLRLEMRTELRKLQQRLSITSVYVTHDQGEAMSISDRVVIINHGVIQQIGTPEEIYQYPRNKFVADFIGKVNFFPTRIVNLDENMVSFEILGIIFEIPYRGKEFQKNKNVLAAIRPESIQLLPKDEAKLKGKIKKRVYLGSVAEYKVEVNGMDVAVAQHNPKHYGLYEEGEEISLQFSSDSIHLIFTDGS